MTRETSETTRRGQEDLGDVIKRYRIHILIWHFLDDISMDLFRIVHVNPGGALTDRLLKRIDDLGLEIDETDLAVVVKGLQEDGSNR